MVETFKSIFKVRTKNILKIAFTNLNITPIILIPCINNAFLKIKYLQEDIVSGINVGLVNSSGGGVFLIVSFFLNLDAKFENVPPKMEEPLGVKVRNMKMDFNTGDTWRRVGQ